MTLVSIDRGTVGQGRCLSAGYWWVNCLEVSAGLGDAVAVGVGDGLGAVPAAGLGEDLVDVALDGGLAYVESLGDLRV